MIVPSFLSLVAVAGLARSQSCPAPAPAQPETVAENTAPVINHAEREPDTLLGPVPNPEVDPENLQNIVPAANVSVNWGGQRDEHVHVALEMNHPTVLLEEIGSIATVDCEPSSVTIKFSRADAFKEAVSGWSVDGKFVLVTNHLGDCDAENERGWFLAQDITSDSDTLTVVALGEKSDIQNTAGFTEITFSAIPAHSKRAVTWDTNGLTLSHSVSLPPATTLFSYHHDSPLLDVQVTADNADVSMGVTFSGKLRYSIFLLKLYEMSFDIDAHASVDLGLSASLTAQYNNTFSYKAPPLEYSIVKVPGIVSIGPALNFDIGVDLAADAAAKISTNVGAKITDGNFHVDFLDHSKSSSTGWTPTFYASANMSERVAVTIDPYVDVTAKLEFELLGGLLDLSGGMTARPRFNNDFTLIGSEQFNATWHRRDEGRTRHLSRSEGEFAGCNQGLGIKSDFEFSLIAFVTQWWQKNLFTINKPIADKCYSWA